MRHVGKWYWFNKRYSKKWYYYSLIENFLTATELISSQNYLTLSISHKIVENLLKKEFPKFFESENAERKNTNKLCSLLDKFANSCGLVVNKQKGTSKNKTINDELIRYCKTRRRVFWFWTILEKKSNKTIFSCKCSNKILLHFSHISSKRI